jgi:hypothetical protein
MIHVLLSLVISFWGILGGGKMQMGFEMAKIVIRFIICIAHRFYVHTRLKESIYLVFSCSIFMIISFLWKCEEKRLFGKLSRIII